MFDQGKQAMPSIITLIKREVNMSDSKTYRLFISHSWNYGKWYDSLISLLDKAEDFEFRDYSVPKDDPVHDAGSDSELYDAIKAKIKPVNCVLILTGVYATYSKWINNEIMISKEDYDKPVIAIEPWGAKRTSTVVKDNADIIVKWNTKSIIDAIKKYSI